MALTEYGNLHTKNSIRSTSKLGTNFISSSLRYSRPSIFASHVEYGNSNLVLDLNAYDATH